MKVAICTPHHGDVKAHYAFSLASMTAHTVRARPEIELRIFMVSSSLLPKSRTMLAEQALGWGADWLLLMDADHLFPPDGRSWMTEDMYFFGKLREAGTRLHVDHALSWEVGHVAERVLTNADIQEWKGS